MAEKPPCPHTNIEAQVQARPTAMLPQGQRYQVLVRLRCAACTVPLTFELPPGFVGDTMHAATMSSDAYEARLGATLKTPVPTQDVGPWLAVTVLPHDATQAS
jgi:hypothetical protein